MSDRVDLGMVAMHEAGHVVIAHYYGRRVYGARLGGNTSAHDRSHVRFALTPHVGEVHLHLDQLDTRWPLAVNETLVTTRIRLAGPLAQSIYQRKSYRNVQGGQDYYDALMELLLLEKLRLSLPSSDSLDTRYKADDILDDLAEEVLELLRAPQLLPYIGKICRGLLENQELSGEAIATLLEDMPCKP